MTSPNGSILAIIAAAQESSRNAWDMAVDTAGPEYGGGSEERAESMRIVSDECDELYDDAIAALHAGDIPTARAALEQCRSLEAEGGDGSDAAGALEAIDAAALGVEE